MEVWNIHGRASDGNQVNEVKSITPLNVIVIGFQVVA